MSIVRYSAANDFVPTSFSNLIDRFFNDSVARTGGLRTPLFLRWISLKMIRPMKST